MTADRNALELIDADERERAVATFDRNLVVTAGAGTGKTTLLVDRLAHLLLRNPEPLRITEIVALTFTNKAANEMKLRLRDRLQGYLAVRLDREPAGNVQRKAKADVEALLARYQLSKDDLDGRIHDALRNIERSDIGTIHSFAATLLRLYPLEAGVDPQFNEDDGAQFDRLFDEQWDLWLDHELSLRSPQTDNWKAVLGKVNLDHIKALAKSLASETVELKRAGDDGRAIPQALKVWLNQLEARAASLSESYPDERMNEKLVRAAQAVIQAYGGNGPASSSDLSEARALLAEKSISRALKGWSSEDIGAAQALVRIAKGLCQVD
ncbi:MAG: UvrD-helicase domain-containing protein, partial [Chloroflexota bacterium]